jgi:hypothetical protein
MIQGDHGLVEFRNFVFGRGGKPNKLQFVSNFNFVQTFETAS